MRRDYQLSRRGDDNSKPIQLGRAVFDAQITLDDETVTSPTAGFSAGTDVGAIVRGVGIPEGTTIATVTDGEHAELSAPATKTAVLTRRMLIPDTPLRGFVIQARDVTGWTFISQIRRTPQSTGEPLGAAVVNTDNAITGLLLWQVLHAVSATLPEIAWYDLQATRVSDGWRETWQHGKLITPPDVTR